MGGRGSAGREDGGRVGKGGRSTAGRGGRGGSSAATPPPPPAGGGCGRAGVGYTARGGRWGSSPFADSVAPGRGRGFSPARGRGLAPSSSSEQQPRPAPFQRSPSARGRGRGYAGSPVPGVSQSAAFAVGSGVVAGGKLFGHGPEAVAYDRDKERGLWKVGPPAGQRFSAAWLRGLENFVAWKRQQQAAEQAAAQRHQAVQAASQALGEAGKPHGHVEEKQNPVAASPAQLDELVSPAGMPPGTVEGLAVPARPPVTAERLPLDAGSAASSHGSANVVEGEPTVADSAAVDREAAQMEAAQMEAASFEAATEGAAETGPAGAVHPKASGEVGSASGREGSLSRASSASSDLGWASVLGAAVAAAVASPGVSPSASFGSADAAASSQAGAAGAAAVASVTCEGVPPAEAASSQHRRWWPPSPPSLEAARPVAVERGDASAAAAAGAGGSAGPPLQLSIRLERQALTDPEAAMLADWCCERRGNVDVRKLWLFDNRLTDAGAAAVARILAAHPCMQEVHLSHNMLTLRGAAALLEALPVGPPAAEGSTAEQAAAAQGSTAEQAAAAHILPEQASEPGSAADAAGTALTGAAAGAGERPVAPAPAAVLPSRPCWLRMEWNRISLEGLMQELESQHARRGLVVDLPSAVRADATPNLPDLPAYLAAAAATAPAPPTPVPASRGVRNTLQHQVEHCHARMPWVSCQYQLPSEAAVLKVARRGWQAQQSQQAHGEASAAVCGANVPSVAPPPPPPRPAPAEAEAPADTALTAAPEPAAAAAAGPLLLFPDTSALLPMLGAGAGVCLPTFFTLDMLGRLAQQGRFGRALAPHEQVFVVVTDSVLKQLDGLKNDSGARASVRRFLGQGLDAYGPAGADFLTVLGAHEGEGLLVEHDAAVAGSADTGVGTKGQRADHRIVEVALFFQREVLRGPGPQPGTGEARAAAGEPAGCTDGPANASSEGNSSSGTARAPPRTAAAPAAFPVLLLSGDNAQVLTARAHGLPAARMSELAAAQAAVEAALERGQAQGMLGASLLRSVLGTAATAGLGTTAGRSLQAEFDEAVSVLAAAADALAASQACLEAAAAAAGSEAAAQDPAAALQAVRGMLGGRDKGMSDVVALLPALRARLGEWRARVKSHQDPSRVLRWAVSS